MATSFVKEFRDTSYPTLWQLSACKLSSDNVPDLYVPALSSALELPDKKKATNLAAGIRIRIRMHMTSPDNLAPSSLPPPSPLLKFACYVPASLSPPSPLLSLSQTKWKL